MTEKLYTLSATFWHWLIGSQGLTKSELVMFKESTEAAYHRAKNVSDRRRLAGEIRDLEREIEGLV